MTAPYCRILLYFHGAVDGCDTKQGLREVPGYYTRFLNSADSGLAPVVLLLAEEKGPSVYWTHFKGIGSPFQNELGTLLKMTPFS